jgi:RNA polymerase sigma-70 factor, ECF subfamily
VTAAAFEAQVLPLIPRLREKASHFTRGRDAEDLVQETLLRAWKAWGRAEVVNPWGWVWLIMRNTFLDRRASAVRWREIAEAHAPDVAAVRAAPPQAPDVTVMSGPDDDLRRALDVLTPGQRGVVELHLAGVENEDVAKRLGIELKTVRTTLCKARARMRAIL